MNSFPDLNSSTNSTNPSPFNPKLHYAKQTLYPPYFSSKTLSETILDLTKAELDLSFQASLTLHNLLLPQRPSQSHDPYLLEAWDHLYSQYTQENKAFFYPPEHFLKGQEAQGLIDMTAEAKKEAFSPLAKFIEDVENMKNQVNKSTLLKDKEQISKALRRLEAFYSGYQDKFSALISEINQKRLILHLPHDQELEELCELLKPKALLLGDIFGAGATAFRMPQEIAQKILADKKMFKPSSTSIFQNIEQSEMVSSLYRLLDIPIPHKTPIGLVDESGNLSFFEVSEAIPESIPIPEDGQEWSENHHKTFCLQVLGTLLTTPSNPQFIYDPAKHGPILASSDSYFNPALSLTDNPYKIESESPLYTLPAMDRPLPDSLKISLQNLSIDLLLLTWLRDLEIKRQRRQQLTSACLFYSQDLPQPSNTIPNALIDSLKTKLSLITKACATHKDKTTPQNLLETIFPTLGAHYKTLRNQQQNPIPNLQNPSELEVTNPNSSPFTPVQDLFHSTHKAYLQANPSLLDTFMEKHGERRKKNQLDPLAALRELLLYLELFNTRHLQRPRDFVYLWDKGRKAISQDYHETWDLLFSSVENLEVQWFMALDKYLPRDWKISSGDQPDDPSEVRGALLSKRQLSPELQRDILNQQQSLRPISLVRFPRDQAQAPVFYFRKEQELAVFEYAVTGFLREFGVEGIPFCELLIMKDPIKGLYPVVLMQAIEGKTLEKLWLQNDHIFDSLDPHHTQMLILGSILLNPEDGRAGNFILTANEKRIIPIHNGHVFVPGLAKNKELLNKTILYCLPEMNKPIQESVIKQIINIDIDSLLKSWLAKLIQISENCYHLPSDDTRVRDGSKGIFYRIGFAPNFIEKLYTKLHKMQEKLLTSDGQLRPFDLLLELEPEVGKAYQEVFLQESTVRNRFSKLTGPLYKSPKDPRYNSLELLEILGISPEELVGKYLTPKIGPAEALDRIKSCSQVHKKIFHYMNLINGRVKIDIEDARTLQGKTEKDIVSKKLMDKELQILALRNFSIENLSEAWVSEVPLKALILPGAKNLTQGALKILGKSFGNLESLMIGDNVDLKALTLKAEDFNPFTIKNLKHLNVNNCPNLMYLKIECPGLEALEIAGNINLKVVGLMTTKLRYLDCKEERLEIMYVNRGIKKADIMGRSAQELEEKMGGIELLREAEIVEKVLVSNMDEKGKQEILEMMFPEGMKKTLEKKLKDESG